MPDALISRKRGNKSMAVVRGFAATAVFAGLVVGTAGPAWAETPTMSGTYMETSTSPSGKMVSTDWSISSCGEGCLWVKAGAGSGQARLVDGQWVMDTMNSLACPDGTNVMHAANSHITWDPTSLAGTSEISYMVPACGHPAGFQQTNQIKLKAPSS
jgi:hypothetical protein